MVIIKNTRMRVFKCSSQWISQSPTSTRSHYCFDCKLLFHVSGWFPSRTTGAAHEINLSKAVGVTSMSFDSCCLYTLAGTEILISDELKHSNYSRHWNNIEFLAKSLAWDLQSRFHFWPDETVSGQPPLTVIVAEIEVEREESDPELDQEPEPFTIYFRDENMQEILDFCLGIPTQQWPIKPVTTDDEPEGLYEVMPALVSGAFDHDDNDGDDDDDIGGEGLQKHMCPICLEGFSKGMEITETPCSHIFHKACITQWLVYAGSCPMCRSLCLVSVWE